jgi:aminopeptidase N
MVEHVDLAVQVLFEDRILDGVVDLKVRRVDPAARTLMLDTRDLSVREVALVLPSGRDRELRFRFGETDPKLGTPLEITLPQSLEEFTSGQDEKNNPHGSIMVRVTYHTGQDASGLQWLTPQQTAGKKHPFLFTQSQAIHARSWIPLQDTPAVRVTYRATIFPPEGLVAVMSAARDERGGGDVQFDFEFEMTRPIPSYLIALAVGDLKFKSLGPRTGVYAEPSVLEAAAHEFADTESMLKTCEELFGPYYWERYDLLILPPSFPFGGMENPRLSFITPTIIAGDRSLVSLIAHEMAHSWSGNMVTNATWRDLWLNEGFTVYLEARIMEALYGERRRAMEDVLALKTLRADLARLPPQDQVLAIDLRGRDPDDVFSSVPYEKGRFFLVYLESKIGREKFHNFLGNYFAQFAFKSITTEQFLDYLREKMLGGRRPPVTEEAIKQWVYGPGLPEDAVLPQSDALVNIDEQRRQWLEGRRQPAELGAAQWSTQEWLHFLDNMPGTLALAQLQSLDAAFKLTSAGNAEVAHSWLKIAVRNRYEPAMARLEEYLVSIGRRKLIKPLYEELMKTDWGVEFAQRVYKKARPGYHPIAVNTLDAIVLAKTD